MWAVKRTLVVSCDCQTHPTWFYTKTKRVLGALQQPNVPLSWWFKTTRTLGRWRLLSGGGGVVVDGDDGVGYDDDGDGEVAVMVVLAAVGQQPERRGREKARVGASGVDGRVDRVTRKLFEAHKKTLPEKFSARRHGGTARWQGGRRWGRAAGIHGEGESI
ncbi:hypothetical protein Tco_0504720 [Tanacetum coccineum]